MSLDCYIRREPGQKYDIPGSTVTIVCSLAILGPFLVCYPLINYCLWFPDHDFFILKTFPILYACSSA